MSDETARAEREAWVRRVDPDRWLSSRFIGDAVRRDSVLVIYAFDHDTARLSRLGSNPLLAEIRLAWWRESIDAIFEGGPVQRHPTLQELARIIHRHSLDRALFESMIDARLRELDPTPFSDGELLQWAMDTGGACASLAADVLGPAGCGRYAKAAGAAWVIARRRDGAGAGLLPELRARARADARALPATAFPAVAHLALSDPKASELAKRFCITVAVALGRI